MTGFIVCMGLLFLYFLPAIAAKNRHHSNFGPIFIINLFFGWTIIGWVAALAWAYSSNVSRETIENH